MFDSASKASAGTLLGLVLGTVLGAGLVGCSSSGEKLFPVTGTVTVDGNLLEAGSVTYTPDSSQGNSNMELSVGTIVNGKYELSTRNRPGAPPGPYKVTVVATNFSGNNPPAKGATAPVPRSLIPLKYGNAGTTPLVKQVVEFPADGAYDLQLSGE
jgi:hypothetical protein